VLALRGKRHGTTHGVVRDAGGDPVGGVLVSALNHSLAPNDDARVRNEARTAADGTFTLTLPPGDYVLVAHASARARGPEVSVTIADGADVDAGALAVGGTGRVEGTTTFVDVDGSPRGAVPAKLTLVPTGDTQRPSESLAQFRAGGGVSAYQVTKDGVFALDVVPGTYRAYVSRGFEWERAETDIVVADGGTTRVDLTIARAFDAPGAVNAEMHQHSLGSIDANVPVAIKIMENAAEGIEIGVSTDHDNVTDFRPHIEALGIAPFIRAFAGNEVSYQSIGHFNVYPWTIDAADPAKDAGSRLWWGKTVPQMFADVRALATPATNDAIVQINHPRATLTGYFAALLVNPVDASRIPRDPPSLPSLPDDIYTAWAGDFDAVEVNGNLGDASLFTAEGAAVLAERAANQATDVPTLADYFGLLGAGMNVVAVGNSDSHHVDEGVGYPRNFVFAGDDPLAIDEGAFKSAIRAQRVAVGEGCMLTLTADDALRMGRGELVDASAAIAVHVQAPSFVSVGALEVYVNGRVQPLVGDAAGVAVDEAGAISLPLADPAPRPVARVDAAITGLSFSEDSVVFALARNGGGLDPTGAGGVFCYAAPLYVDGDGDGAWTPWLAETQEVAPE
jgi:hypothetical protein